MTLEPGTFIWATRGRLWGFRFLRDGGFKDPLPVYERAFAGVANERQVTRVVDGVLVLRFPDPEGRQDRARRTIAHDFVIRPNSSGELPALADAADIAWDSVAADYTRLWAAEEPTER